MFRRRRGTPVWIGISLLVLAAIGTACTSASSGTTESESFTSVEGDGVPEAPPLDVVYETDTILCDGQQTLVAKISGAEPGEVLAFTSALPVELADAVADGTGGYAVNWSCEPEESRLQWTLTASGRSSGRSGTISFKGTGQVEEDPALAFAPAEDPFVCNGQLRELGTLSGALPDEILTVASPHTGSTNHRADGLGEVFLGWQCTPDEAADWEVTVDTSAGDRSLRFMVRGVPPDPTELAKLTVEVSENPFACDGKSRAFATVSNLYAFEDVTFTADGADGLLNGMADQDGNLALRWQCGLSDVGTTWNLTANGADSGRSVSVTFTGGEPTAGSVVPLSLTVAEDPFICDGKSRQFATIGNLVPNEFVDFTSQDAENLREGQANHAGLLAIRWQCSADDAGRTWTITATGRTSGKSIAVTITGAPTS